MEILSKGARPHDCGKMHCSIKLSGGEKTPKSKLVYLVLF